SQPWLLQFVEAMFLTDLVQYWFHRGFHRWSFLWGFHAVHHSAEAMDWLAGSRMHFVEIVLLRGVTSLPLLTLGFAPSVMQAYVAMVYIYASLVHANLRGNFDNLGKFLVTPRFHHTTASRKSRSTRISRSISRCSIACSGHTTSRRANGRAAMVSPRKCRAAIAHSWPIRSGEGRRRDPRRY
ncbi:MAG: sterol desaturase, partial [Sphingomonas bacterium]|nr:sterol desaturase [Sphingomonas bacterium]